MTALEPPVINLSFETGLATHVGLVRQENEDSLITLPEVGLWAVADGMGGYEGGRFASQTLVTDLSSIGMAVSEADQVARFRDRVMRANAEIQRVADERGGVIIGTTIAALLIYGSRYTCIWAGDSRVYLSREGKLAQVSRDHRGAGNNVITRAVGVYDDPDLELLEGRVLPGDTFLICSDGLTGHVSDDEIGAEIIRSSPQLTADALIETTLARGASDNVTVIVIRCHAADTAQHRG